MSDALGVTKVETSVSTSVRSTSVEPPSSPQPARWCRWPQASLTVLTLLCLLPFSNKAFHIDDPIFLWTARQIVQHPLDPYGFTAVWWWRSTPMWQIQQNPPLAAYYMALVGLIGGWSERALHLGFLLPALVVILGTYHLALRFTRKPLLAAMATLVTPGFLVSATGLMCDVMMLALWMLAILCWIEGWREPARTPYLVTAGFLIGACALTKYFGMALIPLLLVYSLARDRKLRGSLAYLLIPVFLLAGYEFYTWRLYGHGLIAQAILHSSYVRELEGHTGRALIGLSYTGGCTLTALTFVPLLWSRRQVLWGSLLSIVLATLFYRGWIDTGKIYLYEKWLQDHRLAISFQLMFFVAGGLSVLALALADIWRTRDAVSLLLSLWILGTIFFAVVVNWTVNARSLLPLIPAAGILIARHLDQTGFHFTPSGQMAVASAMIVSAAISLWAAAGDMALANTARMAANYIGEKTRGDSAAIRFEGRWGFEYYMEDLGAQPLQPKVYGYHFGDLIVIPLYNTSLYPFPLKITAAETSNFNVNTWIATMNPDAGAGFYFSGWGPLPFAIGPVPGQRYTMARLVQPK